jgi:hypothetical protein
LSLPGESSQEKLEIVEIQDLYRNNSTTVIPKIPLFGIQTKEKGNVPFVYSVFDACFV